MFHQKPLNKPRKRSESHYDQKYRLDGCTSVIHDQWLYEWSKAPPEPFTRSITVFGQFTIADISENGWTLIKPAVKELSDTFGIQRPEVEREIPFEAEDISTNRFELLSLNHFYKCPCLLGIQDNKFVVAATKISNKRSAFVPYLTYATIRKFDTLKNLRYLAGYRHFQAKFDGLHTFHTSRQKLPCSISYGLDLGVHGKMFMWASLTVNGIIFPTPHRVLVSGDLTDLTVKMEQLEIDCRLFVQKLESMLLKVQGIEPTFRLIKRLTAGTAVTEYILNSLRKEQNLRRCITRFDVLLEIMKTYYLKSDETIPTLISLARNFTQ